MDTDMPQPRTADGRHRARRTTPRGAAHRRTALRRAALATLAAGTLAGAGCSLLDVTNPNNVIDSALDTPAAATPLANGTVGATIRALNAMLDVYGTASDELDFVGSQDGFFQLDAGNVSSPVLQFSDNGFQQMATARWTGDETIRRLEVFDGRAELQNRNDLTTAYLYTALTYVTIGDMFDDFAIASDRSEGAPPVGEENMGVVYDRAIEYLDRGLAIATATNNAALRTQLTGLRARARHARAVWAMVNPLLPQGEAAVPAANPLVNDAAATADATAALALMGGGDYALSVTPVSTATGGNNFGADLNQRREVRIGEAYAAPDSAALGANRTRIADGQPVIVLADPVSGTPDLALRQRVATLIGGGQFLPAIVVSAREMHLILAEAALARGDLPTFTTHVNAVRALVPGQTPFAGQVDPQALLVHMRRVNLFMQGRRLSDMYRFGQRDPRWQQTSPAYQTRGCFFPITQTERQSNPNPIPRPLCEG